MKRDGFLSTRTVLCMHQVLRQIAMQCKASVSRPWAFMVSAGLFILCSLMTLLQYLTGYSWFSLSLILWVALLVFSPVAFLPRHIPGGFWRQERFPVVLIGSILLLFTVTHLWNFHQAPWNGNGLFDDAAWDIYFVKDHVSGAVPFQAAYFDDVGSISREVLFHYYVAGFFRLFGANLLVFTAALMVLGALTVLFTTLTVSALFHNRFLTIITACIINFYPLQYMHIFMGHRYAIAVPLMVISLYFLTTAFGRVSPWRAVVSGIAAALCLASSVTGKQYVYALVFAGICWLVTDRRARQPLRLVLPALWGAGFVIGALPLIFYIAFHPGVYAVRENGLIADFLGSVRDGGFTGIAPYIGQLKEVFFAPLSYRRQFLPDFPAIPYIYYVFIVPGLVISILKKRFDVFYISLIPVIGAFISGAYDFRILLAVPGWIIVMALTMHTVLSNSPPQGKTPRWYRGRRFLAGSILFGLSIGLIPSVSYLWRISRDPNAVYFLPHRDVAVSRLVQDIVAGEQYPTSAMKWDEFRRKPDGRALSTDTFVCPQNAYAIMHLYLQAYDDRALLAFCNQWIMQLMTQEEILRANTRTVGSYRPHGKDLRLIWEVSDRSQPIIGRFRQYAGYGEELFYTGAVDGNPFSVYVLTIRKENIAAFQNDVAKEFPPGAPVRL